MPTTTRARYLNKTHSRKKKMNLLRKRYLAAKTEEGKNHILDKVKATAPWLSTEQFLSTIKAD